MKSRVTILAAAALAVAMTIGVASAQRGPARAPRAGAGPGAGMGSGVACPFGGTRVTGQITAINAASGVIDVNAAGQAVAIRVNNSTVVKSGPDAVALKDIKVGQSVTACGEMNGSTLDALMLNVLYRGASGPGMGAGMGAGRGRGMGPGAGRGGPGAGMCLMGPFAGAAGMTAAGRGPGAGCPFGTQVCGQITAIDSPGLALRVDTGNEVVLVRTDGNTLLKSGPSVISFNEFRTGQSVCSSGTLDGQTLKANVVNVRFRGR